MKSKDNGNRRINNFDPEYARNYPRLSRETEKQLEEAQREFAEINMAMDKARKEAQNEQQGK